MADPGAAVAALGPWIIAILTGLAAGLVLFLQACGLTVVFSLLGVMNLAHGAFHLLGACIAFELVGRVATPMVRFVERVVGIDRPEMSAVAFMLAALASALIVGVLGAGVERFALRPLRRRRHAATVRDAAAAVGAHDTEMLFTFGLGIVVTELVRLTWGDAPLPFELPVAWSRPWLVIGTAMLPGWRAVFAVVAVVVMAVVAFVAVWTRWGLLARAAISHPEAVDVLGHDRERLVTRVFAIGCGLAALGGAMGGAAQVTEPAMGQQVGALLFAVVVSGGLGSVGGAFIASLLFGLAPALAVAADADRIAALLPFVLMLTIVAWRPHGLAGSRWRS